MGKTWHDHISEEERLIALMRAKAIPIEPQPEEVSRSAEENKGKFTLAGCKA